MSIHLSIDLSTFLADLSRTLSHDHPGQGAAPERPNAACPTCALLARAQQVAADVGRDPDAPLFAALEAAAAGDAVSNTVDHLEASILLIAPCLKVDPRALLRAVIVTAQQRLDWGYGPIGGARADAAPASGDWPTDASDDGAVDPACDAELTAALDAAAVAVAIEAEIVVERRPDLDTTRVVQLIVKRLRDTGWTI